MLSKARIEARIGESALMLDRLEPEWRGRIDLERLDVGQAAHCVVGQLRGSYQKGRKELVEQGARARELRGFEATGPRETSATEFRMLTDGWRRFIAQTPELVSA